MTGPAERFGTRRLVFTSDRAQRVMRSLPLLALILVVLFVTAILDLMVGVSNDAVNFLNSAVGSKVAPRRTIMIIAALGVLAGTTFSSGMMEVARKGIFNPEFFSLHEVMIIFLAVMLTDILLLYVN